MGMVMRAGVTRRWGEVGVPGREVVVLYMGVEVVGRGGDSGGGCKGLVSSHLGVEAMGTHIHAVVVTITITVILRPRRDHGRIH